MTKTIALIAHDKTKPLLADWVNKNSQKLSSCNLIATATTGTKILETTTNLNITLVASGPLGGDQQIGALITEKKIDALIFFPDPLTAMPHDVDVKALLRIALVHNIPCALNIATAELIVKGGLFGS